MDEAERAARRERMRAAMGPESQPASKETESESENVNRPPLGKRFSKGCLWIGGGFFVLVLFAVIFGDPPEDVPNSSNGNVQAAQATVVEETTIREWYQSILKTAKPCDTASAAMGEAMEAFGNGRGSTLAVYQAAIRAEGACRQTSLDYGDLSTPSGLPEAVEDAIDETHDTCSNGFVLRQMAAEKAAEVFDGAMSNSNITELQKLANDGQTGVLACIAAAMKTVDKAGIDIETVSEWNEES